MEIHEKNSYEYYIRSSGKASVATPAVIGDRFLATLDALSRVDSIFRDWDVIDRLDEEILPLTRVRPDIATFVDRNVSRDDYDEPDPDYGYSVAAMNGAPRNSRRLTFTARVGGRWENTVELQAGTFMDAPDTSILGYALFKAALLAIGPIWPCTWIAAQAFKLNYSKVSSAPGVPPIPYSLLHIPWVVYVKPPLALGLTPPPNVKAERTADGGLLLIATEQTLDPTNPAHMAPARAIAELMIAKVGKP